MQWLASGVGGHPVMEGGKTISAPGASAAPGDRVPRQIPVDTQGIGGMSSPDWRHLARDGALVIAALLSLVAAAVVVTSFRAALGREGAVGIDFSLYVDRTRSWLEGDGFYLPRQLAGHPYPAMFGDAYYPPVAMLLTLPFTFGIPRLLWWVIPVTLLVASIIRIRPTVWALPVIAAILAYPRTWVAVICGNPSIWALAFLAAGLAWRWPAVFLPFKVTLAPFALIGIHRRSWWIGAAVGVALCLPFAATWVDWATAMGNVRMSPGHGLDYVLGEWPIALGIVAVGLLSSQAPNRAIPSTYGAGTTVVRRIDGSPVAQQPEAAAMNEEGPASPPRRWIQLVGRLADRPGGHAIDPRWSRLARRTGLSSRPPGVRRPS